MPKRHFAFFALVHGLVAGPSVRPMLADIDTLNRRAEGGVAEVTKISVAAFAHVRTQYVLLRSGGTCGHGMGPVVVTRSAPTGGGRIAIPGERTTAALLLRLLGRFETVPMAFDKIEAAIHEGRFTFESKGLMLLADLGEIWSARMHCPLPLGAIAIRQDLAPRWANQFEAAIRASIRHALTNPNASREYTARHAQAPGAGAVERHIGLYVNDYSLDANEAAVQTLIGWAEQQQWCGPAGHACALFI